MTAEPIDQCLAIQNNEPRLVRTKDFRHVDKISLLHIPTKFQPDYRALLLSYSDVFSKDNLDLGHCKDYPTKYALLTPTT